MSKHQKVGLSVISAVILAFVILLYSDLKEYIVEPFYYPTFIACMLVPIVMGIIPWIPRGKE